MPANFRMASCTQVMLNGRAFTIACSSTCPTKRKGDWNSPQRTESVPKRDPCDATLFMSLSYYYSFSAPANTNAEELKEFLKRVEKKAQGMGFNPTLVLDASFDTPERKQFSRRLTTGLPINDERLKSAALPAD